MGKYWSNAKSSASSSIFLFTSQSSIYVDTTYPYSRNTIRCVAAKGLEVKLMTNDGTGRVGGRVYAEAGSSATLPTPTRYDYTFNGWNTAADGSGTSYTNSYTFNTQATTGITLYAQWLINQ